MLTQADLKYHDLNEVLDDLATRFIINVPNEELSTVERVFFQIEEAHWFYQDFILPQNPHLHSMGLKYFASLMLQHCPLLAHWSLNPNQVYSSFLKYKTQVPVCGAIIFNQTLDKILLVKGWTSKSSWGFPRGKINKKESKAECAKREVLEETGFDMGQYLKKNDYIEKIVFEHCVRLYYITGVPEDTVFVTQTRKEISDIKWFPIKELLAARKSNSNSNSISNVNNPDSQLKDQKFILIAPFIVPLSSWVNKLKKNANRNSLEPHNNPTEADRDQKSLLPITSAVAEPKPDNREIEFSFNPTSVYNALQNSGLQQQSTAVSVNSHTPPSFFNNFTFDVDRIMNAYKGQS